MRPPTTWSLLALLVAGVGLQLLFPTALGGIPSLVGGFLKLIGVFGLLLKLVLVLFNRQRKSS